MDTTNTAINAEQVKQFAINLDNEAWTIVLIIFSALLLIVLYKGVPAIWRFYKGKKALQKEIDNHINDLIDVKLINVFSEIKDIKGRLDRKKVQLQEIHNMKLDVQIAEIKMQIIALSKEIKNEHINTNEKLDLIIKGIKK